MINTTTPFPQPRFAGKKAQNKPSVFKTALIGSLLASSGAGASLTGAKANPDKNALTQASPLGVDHHRALALTQGQQTDWDALILDEPGDAFEAGSEDETVLTKDAESKASQRKLLNTNASRPSGRRPYAAAAVASPSLLKEKAAQAAWNASSLTPLNYELFSKITFPFTKPMKPARLIPYTETSIKAQLVPFLNKITKGDKLKNAQALAVFNDPILKKKAPDPKIRAGLASIKALGFDAVIDAYKSNVFSEIIFNTIPYKGAIGYSVRLQGENQQRVWLAPEYKGEDWRLFTETLLHEALHQRPKINSGNAEELIAAAATTPVNVKLVLLDPSLVTQGSEFARRTNTATLFTMLTRGPNGELRLLKSNKPNVLPQRSQGEAFGIAKPQDAQASPGNPVLASLLKIYTGKTVKNPNFDWNTIQLMDQNQKYLSYEELVQAAKLLQLSVMIPRTPRSMMELTEGSNQGPTFTELEPEKMTTGVAATPEADAKDNKAPKLSRRFLA